MSIVSIIGIISFVVLILALLIYVLHIAKENAKEQDRIEQLNSKNKKVANNNYYSEEDLKKQNAKNKGNIFTTPFKEPQTITILKGVAGEFVFALVGIIIWIVMYQIGYLVGLFGIFIMGLTLMGWKWFKKKKLPTAAFYGAGIIATFAIVVAELLSLVIDVMVQQGVNFIDAFTHTINWFKDGNMGWSILIDLGLGFITAGLTMVGFILYQKYNLTYRKQNK